MENINRKFVKRVLAASEKNSAVRRANRVGYHFPVKIMKARMIRNISTAAARMRNFVSRSPSPVPQQSTQASSNQEDENAVLPYNEETDAFNYLSVQSSAEHYNTTAAAAAADANNDWWFENEGFRTEEHEEEELNSDDDDDEINSYISFNGAVNADDTLPLVNAIDTANEQDDQYQQQEVPASPSTVIDYGLDLATNSDDYNLDLTANNDNVTEQQLVAPMTGSSNMQDSLSAVWSWLDNIDPENLTTAEIEQLLLTQTSELASSNLAVAPEITDNNPLLTQTSELASSNLAVASAITDNNQLSNQTSELASGNLATAPVIAENSQHDNVPHEEVTDEENSSPASSNTSLSPSPPAKNRTAIVNKEEDDQIWASLDDINNYNLSVAPIQYHLPTQSQEYATAVNSLGISTNIAAATYPTDVVPNARGTKRPLVDGSDNPTSTKKHQGERAL